MTLQEQFNAINKGTGNKEQFLKHARNLFPQYLTKHLDYNTSINVLKTKQIISEQTNVVTKGFDIWNWKNILAEETKAEEKETSKEVKDKQDAYDATDVKNADNINGNEIWKGYYTEMKDPANADKTGDELKKIVVKNLSKDPLYYTKNGMFGEKGLGYTDEAPGLGKNTQPTSKNASVLGGRDEVNSDSDVVKNSLVGLIKKNVKDTLSGSEAKTSMPKKVKEMEVIPQNSKGIKKMDMPGKEKRIKLKEGLSLAELLAEELDEADTVRINTNKKSTGDGEPKIPLFAFLPKEVITRINNKYPGSIQIISQGGDLAMFVSQLFYVALSGTTRGRYSQDIERKKGELTKYISEIIPSFVRGLIKKNVTITPTKLNDAPMHYVNINLMPTESKIKEISGEGISDSKEKAEINARLNLKEKAKNSEVKETEIKRFTGAKGNFKCIILATIKTEDGYLINLQQAGPNLVQSPWKPMAKDMFTIVYIVRNLKNGKDFEFKTPEKAIEYIEKNRETPTGTPIPLKAIYKVKDNRQGLTKEEDKEFDNFEEADEYFNNKNEENSISEEMNDLYESKLRSIISKLIREELN